MYSKGGKNRWVLFLFLLAGMVLGAFLGYYLAPYKYLSWLDYGLPFGITNPLKLSLGVFEITFGIVFKINIGSLIGLALGIAAYKWLDRG